MLAATAPAPTATKAPPAPRFAIQGDFLMIALPLKPDLPLSASGRSHILAQTLGFTKTDLVYKGKPVTIAAISAIVPLDGK